MSYKSGISAIAVAAWLATTPACAQAVADKGGTWIEDIVVVARKTAENLQTVPIAVTAQTGATLDKAQIVSIEQLPRLAPGIVVQPSTGQPASAFIGIRGQTSNDALLALDQAVGQYFDGVYIARSSGALFNFVDVERVEVLRGAQGTLFGRNTTGGAVSIISNKPTGEFGGMVRGRYGNHSTWETTGVLNVPIKGDELAARFVGQHIENKGYGRNLSFNTPLGRDKSDFLRGSLRFAPGDGPLTIDVIADYTHRKSDGQASGLKSTSPNATAGAVLAACSGPTANPLCPVKGPAGDSYANYAIDNRANGMFDNHFYDSYASMITFSRAKAWGVGVTTTYDLNDVTQMKSVTAWRGVKTDSLSDNDGTPYVLTGGLRKDDGNIIDQHQFSEEVQLSTRGFEDRLQLIVGAFYFTEAGTDLSRSYSAFPLGARRLGYNDGDVENKSYAGFGQFNYNLTQALRFTGGLRYTRDERSIVRRNRGENTSPVTGLPDGTFACLLVVAAGAPCQDYTKRHFGYWSYTAGFDWKPTEDLFLYIKTSKASRAGGFNPRATGVTPLVFNPESVTDYEVGFKVDLLDRRVRMNTAVFQSNYNNIQRTVPAVIGGTLSNTIVNAATARIRGLETEITVKPTRSLQFGLAATFIDPKFKDFSIPLSVTPLVLQDVTQSRYAFVSKRAYTVYGDYTVDMPGGELNLRADYSYRSTFYSGGPLAGPGYQQQFRNTGRIPAYGLLNGQIAYRLKDQDLEIALYGSNITGKKYIQRLLAVENSLGVTGYSPGQPRMYGVRATYRFGAK